MKEKLKIGIFLSDYYFPAWQNKIIEEIIRSDYAEITLLVKNDSHFTSSLIPKKTFGFAILKFHEKIDDIVFKGNSDYCLRKNSTDLLRDIAEIILNPEEEDSVFELNQKQISQIRKYNLDIIVNFGFYVLNGDIINQARYGILSYSMSEDSATNRIATGYWEIVENRPVTNALLKISKTDLKQQTTIYCSSESTYSYSIAVNRNKVFWRASLFIPRVLKGIYNYGDSYLNTLIIRYKDKELIDFNELHLPPSTIPAIKNLFIFFGRIARQICKKIFYTDSFNWILLYEIDNVADVFQKSFDKFKILQPEKNKFWADPFVLSKNDRYYIFVEEFIYQKDKGHISVIELDNTGYVLHSEKIIDRPYHLSYPFIFEMDGNYYMIPETSQDRTIQLFKCDEFPYKWVFAKNIMENICAVDTTLFFHKNKWWLFTCIDESDKNIGCSTELFLYFSDDLFSDEWHSHPCNPVISDIRTARPAGRIFVQDSKVYRPSQDCSVRYGKGFNLNQITLLSESEYQETVLRKIEPDWLHKFKGAHTFNFDEKFTIIDAYSYRKRF
jgi:hypothetical protein